MKYKITLEGKTYLVEVERGEAMLLDEYEALSAPVLPPEKKEAKPSAAPAAKPEPAAPAASIAAPPAAVAKPVKNVAGSPVSAPLPGNIISVKVKEGDQVKAGDVLFVIEAMKMENDITAPKDGTVKQILVSKGQVVSTGDTLAVL